MQSQYPIITQPQPTMYFIGVTTGKSSINKVFPLWMDVLGRPEVVLRGIDHPMHDDPERYRASVAQIKYDSNSLGALVTTHKIDLYNAARDMFDYFDSYAQITGELSSISKLDGRLEGHAKDPITAGLSLEAIIDPGYFGRTGAEVLCLGAGGSMPVWVRMVMMWARCSVAWLITWVSTTPAGIAQFPSSSFMVAIANGSISAATAIRLSPNNRRCSRNTSTLSLPSRLSRAVGDPPVRWYRYPLSLIHI